MRLADVDLFEINEAYAGVVIASMRELGLSTNEVTTSRGRHSARTSRLAPADFGLC